MAIRFLVVLAVGAAMAANPLAPIAMAAPAGPAKVDVPVKITPPKAPVEPGAHAETSLLLVPPEGIKINRYPPVRLKLDAPEGLKLDETEILRGASEPIDDPKDFPFKTIEPITIGFSVAPDAPSGTTTVNGEIKFVYCVASSGYCAPVKRDVTFDVTVAPRRAN